MGVSQIEKTPNVVKLMIAADDVPHFSNGECKKEQITVEANANVEDWGFGVYIFFGFRHFCDVIFDIVTNCLAIICR